MWLWWTLTSDHSLLAVVDHSKPGNWNIYSKEAGEIPTAQNLTELQTTKEFIKIDFKRFIINYKVVNC